MVHTGLQLCFCLISCSLLHRTTAVCENRKGNEYCYSLMAVADYCTLDSQIYCGCARLCTAPPACSVDPNDNDQSCDCPFSAVRCDEQWMSDSCNYTCTLRNSVTCPAPTQAVVPFASFHYNGVVPPAASPAQYMDSAIWECDPGYEKTSGSSQPLRRVCSWSGDWVLDPDQQQSLVCQRKSCGAPPPNQMATPSMTIGYFGDNVTYTCDHTHLQIGGGTGRHRCAENGTWEADDVDPPPLCLGLLVKFVNSRTEAQAAPPGSMTSQRARSPLECASRCAASVPQCFGYTFDVGTGVCRHNTASPSPVITTMKKVLA